LINLSCNNPLALQPTFYPKTLPGLKKEFTFKVDGD
jgi:hypothetical protein